MEGNFWLMTEDAHKANAAAALAVVPVSDKTPMSMKLEPYTADRSKRQNQLSFKWYLEISQQRKEYTPGQIRSMCKYYYGIPILRASDRKEAKSFCDAWEVVEKSCHAEERIAFIEKSELPVTSLMSTKEMSQYLSDIQNDYGGRCRLTDPSVYLLGL